ncbi:MAG: type I-E CRISPR-associated protein Cse2/CasB [Candidatus Marinimicrobia bacterium]|nr:type I-E CRISPR-associated protein Cse2/CasB [Candidatus Neomarinimicrobiota bacterium]
MSIDFKNIAERFEKMGTGGRAELRRCARPEDVALIPAFYRLFPGIRTDVRHQRIAYYLPFVKHSEGSTSLGMQLAKAKISEKRLFQVLRSQSPNDIIQLRRLVQQAEPRLDWQQFGQILFFWNDEKKRRLLEDYFMYQPTNDKE